MTKLFRAVVLFAAIGAVLSLGGLATVAPAQEKDKKELSKKAAAAAAGDDEETGTVEIYKAKDGWRYRVKNAAGKSIAIPAVGYESQEDAMKILNQVKATLNKATVKVLKDTKKK